ALEARLEHPGAVAARTRGDALDLTVAVDEAALGVLRALFIITATRQDPHLARLERQRTATANVGSGDSRHRDAGRLDPPPDLPGMIEVVDPLRHGEVAAPRLT